MGQKTFLIEVANSDVSTVFQFHFHLGGHLTTTETRRRVYPKAPNKWGAMFIKFGIFSRGYALISREQAYLFR